MSKIEKAKDLYLRGFCGEYIKRRTEISIQQLLKRCLSDGISYTKQDIVNYQIAYIRSKYSLSEIEDAYRMISCRYESLEKASKGRHIECLGCGFGQYPVVFTALLGSERYKELRIDCWKKKQTETMITRYGVNNAFNKDAGFLKTNPMYSDESKEKRRQTMIARYGVSHPNQNNVIKSRMLEHMYKTNMERYGVEYAMQCEAIAKKSAEQRQRSMLELYGAPNSTQIDEIRNKIFDARRCNGTLNSSKSEDALYEMLVKYFGTNDVRRNVIVDSRYPYHVDFYIESRDLFIELNGDKCHYTHWFDSSCERDLQVLNSWKENSERIKQAEGRSSRYDKYIKTWTISDVNKRLSAKQNHLNYLVFWDGSHIIHRNGREIPRLRDAREWFQAGCPNSNEWHAENTY